MAMTLPSDLMQNSVKFWTKIAQTHARKEANYVSQFGNLRMELHCFDQETTICYHPSTIDYLTITSDKWRTCF